MPTWDVRDFCAGLLLTSIGGFFAVYAVANLRLGTITNVGPGMVPTVLGSALVVVGVVMSTAALFRSGSPMNFDRRVAGVVLISIIAFAGLISTAGLVPAVVVQILIVSRADAKLNPWKALLFGVGLSFLAVGLFKFGLGVPMTVIYWPW